MKKLLCYATVPMILALVAIVVYLGLNYADFNSVNFAGADCHTLQNSDFSRYIANTKVLYKKGDILYGQQDDTIVCSTDNGVTFKEIGKISYPFPFSLVRNFSILRRIARMDIMRTCITSGNNIVFTTKGGVYCLENDTKIAKCVLPTPESRPISLGYKPDGMLYVGEYVSNAMRKAINIYGSSDEGKTWKVVYTFPAGSIRHVHYIDYDKYDDCFWISTGDANDECRLIKASNDFKKFDVVLRGGQQSRFFETRAYPDCVYAVTDTGDPNSNFIKRIDKKTGDVKDITAVQNSLYFTAIVGDYFLAATACSPYSYDSNDVLNVHVWAVNTKTSKPKELGIFAVDVFTKFSYCKYSMKGLFQYASLYFAYGDNMTPESIFISGNGISVIGDSTAIWDLSKKLDF